MSVRPADGRSEVLEQQPAQPLGARLLIAILIFPQIALWLPTVIYGDWSEIR